MGAQLPERGVHELLRQRRIVRPQHLRSHQPELHVLAFGRLRRFGFHQPGRLFNGGPVRGEGQAGQQECSRENPEGKHIRLSTGSIAKCLHADSRT